MVFYHVPVHDVEWPSIPPAHLVVPESLAQEAAVERVVSAGGSVLWHRLFTISLANLACEIPIDCLLYPDCVNVYGITAT